MKKIGLSLLVILVLIVSSACSNGTNKEKKSETTQQNNQKTKNNNTKTSKTQDTTEQVSVQAGLGDTLEAFQKQYGANKGNPQMGRFQSDYLLPVFINNRAVDITIHFEATDQKSRSMEEAKQIASKMMPKDAKLEKEATDTKDSAKKVMQYNSDTLAKIFPDFKPAGKFLVILHDHEGNENDVYEMNISLGEMP